MSMALKKANIDHLRLPGLKLEKGQKELVIKRLKQWLGDIGYYET